MREFGVLMAVASLPSPHGIGDFGKGAYTLVDKIAAIGGRLWQTLPLNPLGYGNSPYQPYSSFALDELYIDLTQLVEANLLKSVPNYRANASVVAYEDVRAFKDKHLRKAYKAFKKNKYPTLGEISYDEFLKYDWVRPYGIFIAFKRANNLVCWNEWDESMRDYGQTMSGVDLTPFEEEIEYVCFTQYVLYCQWMKLKEYANKNHVEIVGDIPIYVGIDSLDVWMNRGSFLLDDKGHPTFIAGVPPDYFSATGQRWGNPIYDWEYLEEDDFTFWKNRLSYCGKLYDRVRIDHFRAFDTYWKIPSSCPTAVEGEWIEAPGYAMFDSVLKELPDLKIIAEDLGDLRDEVLELRDHYNFPGMKIVQFTFNPSGKEDFEDRENMIVYTGTHDNQMIKSWYMEFDSKKKQKTRRFFAKNNYKYDSMVKNFLAFTLDNIADTAILPIQDILELSDKARLNSPGTLGSPNWEWRLNDLSKVDESFKFIEELIVKSNRK